MTDFDDILGADAIPRDERSEKAIQNDTLISLSELPNSLFWRHNTGQAWQGKRVQFYPGTRIPVPPHTVVLVEARPVKFGLEGSADIIGCVEQIPVAVELKDDDGRQHTAQRRFEAAWTRAGGVYILARSAAEALRAVRKAVEEISKRG